MKRLPRLLWLMGAVAPWVGLGCTRESPPTPPEVLANPSASAAAAVVAPPVDAAPAAPAEGDAGPFIPQSKVTLMGTLKNTSCSWLPGDRNAGRAEALCELYVDQLVLDPPLPRHLRMKDVLILNDEPSQMTVPTAGACKTTLRRNNKFDHLTLDVLEPGCDSNALVKEKFLRGVEGHAVGSFRLGDRPVPVDVHVRFAPRPTP